MELIIADNFGISKVVEDVTIIPRIGEKILKAL